ncbi:MAG: glutamate--tRNA ligase [Planctomycetes bacterium]|jgi:glutamyl-tRNA synthetase|nr:glutamate--tRNA ligase [Phycisphaerae bacterium]NBB94613.1 glutamate--tRNA ligase [Planctomycetota bacterium]
METIKTRFAPSPTGSLHVGGARTALFNWALARKLGGQFLLRIEDTDQARHQEQAVEAIVRDLEWLGIHWDEGIDIGGDHGPYRQSQRLAIYQQHIQQLLDTGKAYYAFETPEELDTLRKDAESRGESFHYQRPADLPTAADAEKARIEGRSVVVRFAVPGHDVTIHDEIFSDVTVPADQQDDFIIAKADGWPTYHLANVVDDHLMGVTLVCRGQEFLHQTWRHILLRKAFEYPEPAYAHLPLIMDMQGRKLSKRDGDVEVDSFRRAGYLPEALVNFLALLGWTPADGREKFTLAEFVALFDIGRVNKSNARFDRDKLLAFNTDYLAAADDGRLLVGFKDYLACNDQPIPVDSDTLLRKVLAACSGLRTYADVVAKAGVLFAADDSYDFDAKAVQKVLEKNDGAGYDVLVDLQDKLAAHEDWTAESLEAFIKDYGETRELGMGKVAQPLRVATTGSTISPGIGDTLEMLGQAKTLARIDRCLAHRDA